MTMHVPTSVMLGELLTESPPDDVTLAWLVGRLRERSFALVIMLVSIAYLEDEGVLLCISLAAALVSLSISAAAIWATARTAGLVDRLLTGL